MKSIADLETGLCSIDFMIDRRLRVLRMVRQTGTVTAAGRALHLTPSAVSQQVRSLARELDIELLQPAGRGVRLTPAAEILLGHADRLEADWERARADLDAHRLGDRGPLRLCAFPSALASLLPAASEQLRHGDPPLDLVVSQADPGESLDRLVAGDADLAIVEMDPAAPATSDARIHQEPLFDDPLHLVVAPQHRLARRDRIALVQAVDEDWVGGPTGGSYHQIELQACLRAGFTPRLVHRALDWSAYLAMVEAGLGVALVPRLAIPPDARVRPLPLTDIPAPVRRLSTYVRRGSERDTSIRRLRDALRRSASPHLLAPGSG